MKLPKIKLDTKYKLSAPVTINLSKLQNKSKPLTGTKYKLSAPVTIDLSKLRVKTKPSTEPTTPVKKRSKKKVKPKIKIKKPRRQTPRRRKRMNVMFKGEDRDIKTPTDIKRLTTILNNNGGRCYIVGGYVRDTLLHKQSKDIDVEVHGLTTNEISHILINHGYKVDDVGKSFGVLKVKDPHTKKIIDVSIPRSDRTGRKPDVTFLKTATPYDAAKRRDITINAIMYDTKDDKVVDPFGGVKDLEIGKIRHVSSDSFKDDPLRTVRAAQFASRFGFTIDPETRSLAREVDASQMAPERVTEEMRKVFEKSDKPSIFFKELDEMGQLDKLFPEVKKLQYVEQDPIHHPEGNTYIHTMQVMDRISQSDKRKLVMLVAALFHDIGKITTSGEDPDTKKMHARGHEIESEKMAGEILRKYKFTTREIHNILSIIKHHMRPHYLVFEKANRLKHKHRLMREICTTKGIRTNPSEAIRRYCDVVDFAKFDRDKDHESYDKLKELPPIDHYLPDVTGEDLLDEGYAGKELGSRLDELYLHKINKKPKNIGDVT